ncbi:MAG: oligosaccharide flippase family protein [Candidatus Bathyarchaeia archaeon]
MSGRLVEVAEDSVRGGFFLFAGNASQLVVLAIASIVIARLLGPEDYGLYSLSLVVPSILAGLVDFGIGPALIRFLAKFRSEGETWSVASTLKLGFLFKLAAGVLMSLICLLLSDAIATYALNRPGIGLFIRLTSLLILFSSIVEILGSSFIGLDRMENYAFMANIQAFAKLLISPLLIILGFSVLGALTGHVVSYFIAGLMGGVILIKYYRGLNRSSDGPSLINLKVMMGYGLPLYASALLGLLLAQYQALILAFFASNAEIGNFNVASGLSSTVNVLIFPLTALFPAFSKLNVNGDELRRAFTLSVKYSALLVIPAAIALSILSKDLVYVLYGHSYGLAPLFLSLYALTFLYVGFGSAVFTHLLSGIGRTSVVLKLNLINLLTFSPMAPVFTRAYGVPGLIVALLISNAFPLTYALHFAIKRLKLSIDFKASLRIYSASLLSALPLLTLLHTLPLNHVLNLFIGGSLFLLAYLTLAPLLGAITSSDLENLRLMFSGIKTLWPLVKPALTYEARLLSLIRHG